MISQRFYQKHHDHLYFELGIYLAIDLCQHKYGDFYKLLDKYNYEKKSINEKNILVPNNIGIHIGMGVRVLNKIMLKPEIRISTWKWDKVYVGNENRSLNTVLFTNFKISYLF